jgi:hypothetical protein
MPCAAASSRKAFEPPPHVAELCPLVVNRERVVEHRGGEPSARPRRGRRPQPRTRRRHYPPAHRAARLEDPHPAPSASPTRATATGSGTLAELIEPPEPPVGGWKGTVSPVAGPSSSTRKRSRSRIGRVTNRRVAWPATAIPSAGRWPKAETAAYRVSPLGRAERLNRPGSDGDSGYWIPTMSWSVCWAA